MTAMTAFVWFLGFVAFFVFIVIPALRWSSYFNNRKNLEKLDPVDAQLGSIKHHNLATGLNSAGLGFGIVLVFYGGMFDERFLTVGVFVVLGSIVSFLVFEWVASKYDELVAKAPTPPIKVDLKGVEVKVAMPESLKFVYPSGAGEQAGTSRQSTQGHS